MSKYFVKRDECAHHTIFPGVDIFTMAGQQVMPNAVAQVIVAVVGSVVAERQVIFFCIGFNLLTFGKQQWPDDIVPLQRNASQSA